MNYTDEIPGVLRRLRMSGVLQSLDLRLRECTEDNLHPGEFLLRLLNDEVERRDQKNVEIRLGKSGIDCGKSFESFDFLFNDQVPKSKIIDLATCAFVRRHQNILLIGPSGVGKSHIAQAIGHRACLQGLNALFVDAQKLFASIRAAKATNSYDKKMKQLSAVDLIIVDDLGLQPLHPGDPGELYELIRLRYERGAMVITSNRAVEEWPPLFGDPLLASAAMDRLLHHATILPILGESYRNPKRGLRKKVTA